MFDIHQSAFDNQSQTCDEISDAYVNGLMDEFAKSPEGIAWTQANGALGWAATMMDLGIESARVTPAYMSEDTLQNILFELIPGEVSVQPDEAYYIAGEIRAFWEFVNRQYKLPQAPRLVSQLDADAEERLRKRLTRATAHRRPAAIAPAIAEAS